MVLWKRRNGWDVDSLPNGASNEYGNRPKGQRLARPMADRVTEPRDAVTHIEESIAADARAYTLRLDSIFNHSSGSGFVGFAATRNTRAADGESQEGQPVFLRIYTRTRPYCPREETLHMLRERHILSLVSRVPHPFITALHFTHVDDTRVFIGLDLEPGRDDLDNHIRSRGALAPSAARRFAGEICLALGHIHSFDVAYRNLAPENVLVTASGHIKLADFEVAKRMTGRSGDTPPPPRENSLCGVPEYLAPEVLLSRPSTEVMDWWSYGALVCEMLCGVTPFVEPPGQEQEQGETDAQPNVSDLVRKIVASPIVIPTHEHIGDGERALLRQLLQRDANARLGCRPHGHRAVFSHPWFHKEDDEKQRLALSDFLSEEAASSHASGRSAIANGNPATEPEQAMLVPDPLENFGPRAQLIISADADAATVEAAQRLREAFESQPLPQPLYIFNIQSSTTDSSVSSSPAPQQAQPRQPPPAMDLF